MAVEVETKEQIASTASISAADPQIGDLIAEAMDKVGKEGVITVEESNTFGLELELTEGMRFDKGYISAYFVTDPERMETELEDPYILVLNSKVSTVKDLLPLLEKVMQDRQAPGDHRRDPPPGCGHRRTRARERPVVAGRSLRAATTSVPGGVSPDLSTIQVGTAHGAHPGRLRAQSLARLRGNDQQRGVGERAGDAVARAIRPPGTDAPPPWHRRT